MAGDLLAEWVHLAPNSGVNNKPLPAGRWEDVSWEDAQTARCSNDRRIDRSVVTQAPTGTIYIAAFWQFYGAPVDTMVNISVNKEDTDPILWEGVKSDVYVVIDSEKWQQLIHHGIYIASVTGADAPFSVRMTTADVVFQ